MSNELVSRISILQTLTGITTNSSQVQSEDIDQLLAFIILLVETIEEYCVEIIDALRHLLPSIKEEGHYSQNKLDEVLLQPRLFAIRRTSEDYCSRIKILRNKYDEIIAPIVTNQLSGDQASEWEFAFTRLFITRSNIILKIRHINWSIERDVTNKDKQETVLVIQKYISEFENNILELIDLRNEILIYSGERGLILLLKPRHQRIINDTDIVEMKKRRLQMRKVQQAVYGISADPSITIEIEQLEAEIKDLTGQSSEGHRI